MSIKTSLIAVALLAVLALAANRAITPTADAAVTNVAVADSSIPSGLPGTTATVDLTAVDADITISVTNATGDATGFLIVQSCTPACPGEAGDTGASVILDDDDLTQVVLTLVLDCVAGGTVNVTATQEGGIDANNTETVTCEGAGGILGGFYQVTATASPNLLPCEGGTAEIIANAYDESGNAFPDPYFHFSTTAGLIEQTSDNTADLTLGPGQTSAIVTVSISDPGDAEVESAEVAVSLACNNFASVVVTANPNVIECGGTSVITATARDANGHVVPGVGFHFATNTGLLVVLPNHAGNEQGIAQLSLQPGQGDSTVVVSVGTALGTVEQTITVQQFCPGVVVGQNASAAPGQVLLNRSNDNLVCGEQIFIGMKIRDSKGQVPPDGTAVNLLATAGLLEPTNTTTVNGAANVVYTAPSINGQVRITAAAGDAYGYTLLNVKCGTASGTGSAGAPRPCTPIGDGVCITPPNTGTRITPPNTGNAGLR